VFSLLCSPAGRSSNDHTQEWLLERTTIARPGVGPLDPHREIHRRCCAGDDETRAS
jgi:hypothetical protein